MRTRIAIDPKRTVEKSPIPSDELVAMAPGDLVALDGIDVRQRHFLEAHLLERLRGSTGSEDEEQAAVLAALFRQLCTDPSGMNTHEPRWTRFDSSPSRAERMLASCDGEDGC